MNRTIRHTSLRLKAMRPALPLLTALLLAPRAALNAADPKSALTKAPFRVLYSDDMTHTLVCVSPHHEGSPYPALLGGPERHRTSLVPPGLTKDGANEIQLTVREGGPATIVFLDLAMPQTAMQHTLALLAVLPLALSATLPAAGTAQPYNEGWITSPTKNPR